MTKKNLDKIGKIGLIETTNPFSGQSILLTEEEHTLYNATCTTIGCAPPAGATSIEVPDPLPK